MPRPDGRSSGQRTLSACLGLVVIAAGGCRDAASAPLGVASVAVTAHAMAIPSGGTLQLDVVVRASDGKPHPSAVPTWTSSLPSVANVSATGLVSAGIVRDGTPALVTIVATAQGVSGSVSLSVTPVPVARITLSFTTATLTTGTTRQMTATLADASDQTVTGRLLEWTSTNAAVASVNAGGLVTAVGPGTTTIEARAEGVSAFAIITVVETPSLTFTMTAGPSYLVRGDRITLAWQSAGVDSCVASGAWSNARPVSGNTEVVLDVTGTRTFVMRCTGLGGDIQREVTLVVRRPAPALSYETFKDNGVAQTSLPVFFGVNAYGDFRGNGNVSLFTAELKYDNRLPASAAARSEFAWWELLPDRTWRRITIPVTVEAPSCLHPRKVLVTEINHDRRPDLLVICHGYDGEPFPGEPNIALVSRADGSYLQRSMGAESRFFHGGATCDLDRDGDVELLTAVGSDLRVYDVSPDGMAQYRPTHAISGVSGGGLYSLECLDIDEDGFLDVVFGGHEPGMPHWTTMTRIWYGSASGTYREVIIPAVPNDGIVLDFTVTGTGATRALWVLRTSGGDGTFYVGNVLQRVTLATMASQIAFSSRQVSQLGWIVPYLRNGQLFLGSETTGFLPQGGRGWEILIGPSTLATAARPFNF